MIAILWTYKVRPLVDRLVLRALRQSRAALCRGEGDLADQPRCRRPPRRRRYRPSPRWWALWLLTNILSNIVAMFGGDFETPAPTGMIYLDLVVAALNVPLCLILIGLMRRLARVQVLAMQASTFA